MQFSNNFGRGSINPGPSKHKTKYGISPLPGGGPGGVPLNNEEIAQRITRLEAEVSSLKEWQGRQNGTIKDVDQKVDGLKNLLMATLGGVLASIFVNLVK